MSKMLLINDDGLTWANPWSKHEIVAPGRDGRLQTWNSPMAWFHTQSIATFDGTDRVVEKIRKVNGNRPAHGNPDDKKKYRPERPWRDLIKDQAKSKINRGQGKSHVVREDWGKIWPRKLLMAMAYKFDQYTKLQELLLETGDAIIVYDISDDTFGAINLDGQIMGDNQVGQILMKIRDQLNLRKETGDTSPLVKYPERRKIRKDPEIEYHDVVIEESVKIEECSDELQNEFEEWLAQQTD